MDTNLDEVLSYCERLPPLKATWPFGYVTSVTSSDILKKLYFHFHKTYGCLTWMLVYGRKFSSTQTLKTSPTSCFELMANESFLNNTWNAQKSFRLTVPAFILAVTSFVTNEENIYQSW